MNLEMAIKAALDGDAVLFTGAGFSIGATNVIGRPFKTGRQFAADLAEKSGIQGEVGLASIAEFYADQFGVDPLIKLLKEEFTARKVTPAQGIIAALPWKRIYTTNYDSVLEQAAREASKVVTPVTLDDQFRNIPKDSTLCIHVNGFVERIDRQSIWNEVKLLDSSYAAAGVSDSTWSKLFRQDLRSSSVIFFVGYSLADLDIKRILVESSDLRKKCMFVVGKHVDRLNDVLIRRYGELLPMDAGDLAEEVGRIRRDYIPRDVGKEIGRSVVRSVPKPSIEKPSDRDVFDLLLLGELRPGLAWQSYSENLPYFVRRQGADYVIELIEKGERSVVIHSELGNGKSSILEWIKFSLAERGFEIYEVFERSDFLLPEIEQVLASRAKKVLIVDDYPDWLDIVDHIGMHISDTTSVIFTARSSANDVMIDRLIGSMQGGEIKEVNLDRLGPDDIDGVIGLFDHYGLWGKRAKESPGQKRRFLERDCNSEFSNILLKLFNSPHIVDRFQSIFKDLDRLGPHRNIIYSMLVGVVLKLNGNRPLELNMLMDVWGDRVNDAGFRKQSIVRELVDIGRGTVRLRSAVAAEFAIKSVVNADIIVEVLAKMARAFDDATRMPTYRQSYREMLQKLMMFRNLQIILPEKNRRQSVITYYEDIKNLYHCRENPNFWLQYAIACLVIDELGRAEKYFENAYSFAAKRQWSDAYQIDNHFARFLLMKATNVNLEEDHIRLFRKAATIIERQINKERLHYPYRVATSYREFVDAHSGRLSDKDRRIIHDAARFVRKRIDNLDEAQQANPYVTECVQAMEYVIQKTHS